MYSIDVINTLNAKAAKPAQTETTRESSFCESRGGLVLHSGVHRSTAFLPLDGSVESLRLSHFAKHPETRDTIIPLIVGEWADVGAIRETLLRVYGVEARRLRGTGKNLGECWEADSPNGRLRERISAPTAEALHAVILTRRAL